MVSSRFLDRAQRHGGLQSLRVSYEQPGADSSHIARAWDAVEGLKLKAMPKPKKISPDAMAQRITFYDLPVAEMSPRSSTAKHVI